MVKLVGPVTTEIEVPNITKQDVDAATGRYTIKVRYGENGNFRYTKGDDFDVAATASTRSETTITLHKVLAGNYDSRPISKSEFGVAKESPTRASVVNTPSINGSVVLQVRRANITSWRAWKEGGYLVQNALYALTKGTTNVVFLSDGLLREELEIYAKVQPATDQDIRFYEKIKKLEPTPNSHSNYIARMKDLFGKALETRTVEWDQFALIQNRMPDPDLTCPWVKNLTSTNQIRIEPLSHPSIPILKIDVTYDSQQYKIQGVIPSTQVRIGAVSVSLTENGQVVFQKTLTAPEWQAKYVNAIPPDPLYQLGQEIKKLVGTLKD